ncbi:MAG TPA: DoxX family protein [Flavobacterium sp.]|nr:DoxX family protein [Flavobacterium sp.]
MTLKSFFTGTAPLALDSGILIARVVVGTYFILHGHELFNATAMEGFAGYLSKDLHFPYPLLMAYLRTAAELFGGIMLILGLFTRLGALLIMFTMLVATFTAGKGDIFGEAEMTVAYAAFCLTILLAGSGKYSLEHSLFKIK